jgi:peptidoglycan-N-acetylglucosamine deacetylase
MKAPEAARAREGLPVWFTSALAGGAVAAFVFAVDAKRASSLLDVVVAAVALIATATAVRFLFTTPAFRPIAVGVGLAAVWLLPQRDDVGAAAISAAFFGGAIALVLPRLTPTRATWQAAGGAAIVALVLRLFGSQPLLLIVAFVCVAAGAIATTGVGLRPAPRSGDRALASLLTLLLVAWTLYVGAVSPHATWFGGGTLHGPTNTGEVALTFDDGPNLGTTLPVMRILDRYHAKGTFFEVGKAVAAAPQITRALVADGQLVGDHSYHHDSWSWLDPRYPELQDTQHAIEKNAGVCPAFYRPPHGYRTPFVAHQVDTHHMHMVLWSVSAGDWATNDAQLVAQRVLAHVKAGSIVLLHDGLDGNPAADRQVLVRALPLILDGLRAKHLTPVRLDQLLSQVPYTTC